MNTHSIHFQWEVVATMLSGHYFDLPDDFSQNGSRQSFVHFIVDL